MPDEVPVADFSTIKEEVVQFFWESLEDAHVSLKSVSQLPENLFFFGTVAAEIAKTGKFTDEVESKLAAVWKADEAWLRALLAGEVESFSFSGSISLKYHYYVTFGREFHAQKVAGNPKNCRRWYICFSSPQKVPETNPLFKSQLW